MGLKFKLEFENVQGDACSVNFLYADYEDEPILLFGGARPFVLSEFNTDQDLFKPVRPQQATIEVLASAAGVKMEDFITDNDEDVVVRFDFGEFTGYWYGYLSQEDIQETWIPHPPRRRRLWAAQGHSAIRRRGAACRHVHAVPIHSVRHADPRGAVPALSGGQQPIPHLHVLGSQHDGHRAMHRGRPHLRDGTG